MVLLCLPFANLTACGHGLALVYNSSDSMHACCAGCCSDPTIPWPEQASVASYNDKLDRLNGDDETRSSIVERLKMFDDQLEGIKAEEQEARDKLTALQQKEEKKYEDIPALKEVRMHRPALCCVTRAAGGVRVGTHQCQPR